MRGILKPAFDSTADKKTKTTIKKWTSIKGTENFVAAYEVDQSPIGKTSRSTPATYVKVFDEIRKLFSTVPESRIEVMMRAIFRLILRVDVVKHAEETGK